MMVTALVKLAASSVTCRLDELKQLEMFKVVGLKRLADSGPQQYKLTVRDTEDTNPNHEGIIHFGTEVHIRSMLKDGGLNDAEIDVMFEVA